MRRILLCLLTLTVDAAAAEPTLVYPLPAEADVVLQAGLAYRTIAGQTLTLDLYRPAKQPAGTSLPAVVFMNGVGSSTIKRSPQYRGWAKLATSIGLAGITFDSHEGAVAEDAAALLAYLRDHARDLHLDARNLILWACSSNVSTGLPFVMDPHQTAIKAAVIYYGAADIKDLRMDLPVMMVRAGLDGAGLNQAIDQFVTRATAANVPLTFLNLPSAHHAFDLMDNNESSRLAIRRTLDFIQALVSPSIQRQVRDGLTEAAAAAAVYRGDWAQAVKSYESLAVTRPQDSEVHRNYGNALLGVGQFQPAIAEYERALKLGNTNVGWISYAAAQASLRLGDRESALKWIGNLRGIVPMQRRLRSDPEFAALSNDPRFRAALAQ